METLSSLLLSSWSLLLDERAVGMIVEDESCPNRICQIGESLTTLRSVGYFTSSKVLSDECFLSEFVDTHFNNSRPCWFSMIDPDDEKHNSLQELIMQLICMLGTMKNDFSLSDECIIEFSIQNGKSAVATPSDKPSVKHAVPPESMKHNHTICAIYYLSVPTPSSASNTSENGLRFRRLSDDQPNYTGSNTRFVEAKTGRLVVFRSNIMECEVLPMEGESVTLTLWASSTSPIINHHNLQPDAFHSSALPSLTDVADTPSTVADSQTDISQISSDTGTASASAPEAQITRSAVSPSESVAHQSDFAQAYREAVAADVLSKSGGEMTLSSFAASLFTDDNSTAHSGSSVPVRRSPLSSPTSPRAIKAAATQTTQDTTVCAQLRQVKCSLVAAVDAATNVFLPLVPSTGSAYRTQKPSTEGCSSFNTASAFDSDITLNSGNNTKSTEACERQSERRWGGRGHGGCHPERAAHTSVLPGDELYLTDTNAHRYTSSSVSDVEEEQLQQAIRESLLTAPKSAGTDETLPLLTLDRVSGVASVNKSAVRGIPLNSQPSSSQWSRGAKAPSSSSAPPSRASKGAGSGTNSGCSSSNSSVKGPAPKPKKPRCRFTRDLSVADGTVLQPGTSFIKKWLVRNDGDATWPEGLQLMHQDGDILCGDPCLHLPVDIRLPAGEETELSIELTAPRRAGRYVSYFTMVTREEQKFGHRLWVDILVADTNRGDGSEEQWSSGTVNHFVANHPVTAALSATGTSTVAADRVSKEVKCKSPTRTGLSFKSFEEGENQTGGDTGGVDAPFTPMNREIVKAPVQQEVKNESVPSSVTAADSDVALLWQRELHVLAEMGFQESEHLISLLEMHIGTDKATSLPVSARGEGTNKSEATGKVRCVEGFQRVIAALLLNGGGDV